MQSLLGLVSEKRKKTFYIIVLLIFSILFNQYYGYKGIYPIDSFFPFNSGYDILEGGEGDDVLIGGDNTSSTGGYIIDIYRFGNDSGNDVISGFLYEKSQVATSSRTKKIHGTMRF